MVLATGCDDDETTATDMGAAGGTGGAAGGEGGAGGGGGAGGAIGGAGGGEGGAGGAMGPTEACIDACTTLSDCAAQDDFCPGVDPGETRDALYAGCLETCADSAAIAAVVNSLGGDCASVVSTVSGVSVDFVANCEGAGPPPFGTPEDIATAQALWTEIEGHQDTWPQPASKHGWVEGSMPHGSTQQYYQNGDDNSADGYTLIKRNYGGQDEAMLGAVTVMKKIAGYAPDTGDWFYAKFLPDGTPDMTPDGTAMVGQVGGCTSCHAGADGDDYLFSFDAGMSPNGAPFGRPVDQAVATNIWAEIADRANWDQPESKQGWQMGDMPHGAWQQFYHNGADNTADGYIVIKENYGAQDEAALGAITLMKKMHGYSPTAGDWFFAKFMPDGTPAMTETGVQLVGKVGLGGDSGCIACHTNAPNGDYLFSFD
jgi:hypothetical protein